MEDAVLLGEDLKLLVARGQQRHRQHDQPQRGRGNRGFALVSAAGEDAEGGQVGGDDDLLDVVAPAAG